MVWKAPYTANRKLRKSHRYQQLCIFPRSRSIAGWISPKLPKLRFNRADVCPIWASFPCTYIHLSLDQITIGVNLSNDIIVVTGVIVWKIDGLRFAKIVSILILISIIVNLRLSNYHLTLIHTDKDIACSVNMYLEQACIVLVQYRHQISGKEKYKWKKKKNSGSAFYVA